MERIDESAGKLLGVGPESVTPSALLDEARKIVRSHRPVHPSLSNFDPQLRLMDVDHQILNGGEFTLRLTDEEREAIFTNLRARYADDPQALEEIDVFDTKSPTFKRLAALGDSLAGTTSL